MLQKMPMSLCGIINVPAPALEVLESCNTPFQAGHLLFLSQVACHGKQQTESLAVCVAITLFRSCPTL